MKRLALFFAIAWWTQGALCVLPLGFSHAHASEPAASRHDHHASAPAPAPEPARGHHSQEDPSCAEHCASLSRALASQAPQPEPCGSEFALLPLDLVPAAVLPLLAPGSAVARGQPPPGLARANPILRI